MAFRLFFLVFENAYAFVFDAVGCIASCLIFTCCVQTYFTKISTATNCKLYFVRIACWYGYYEFIIFVVIFNEKQFDDVHKLSSMIT